MVMREKQPAPILVTVDLEDWFQVENLRPVFPRHGWDSQILRVESNTRLILDLFDQHRVKATFFVLGWNADRCRGLIREIEKRGHEVASHGYGHESCFNLSREALRDDLRRSKLLLEEITGKPIRGYRAPNFSLTEEVMEGLSDLGYCYDSSYNNFSFNGRNGKGNKFLGRPTPNLRDPEKWVIELPVSNWQVGGVKIPWGGGGYFRLWPVSLFEWGVSRILEREGRYVFYFHPWEIDPNQPVVKNIRWLKRFRHYYNLSQMQSRLNHFLSKFAGHGFISCSTYLKGGSH